MPSIDEEDDQDLGPEDEILDRAWSALDADSPEEALLALNELDPDWPERWIPEALALLELGELRRARKLIHQTEEAMGSLEGDGDPELVFARAELALREWRLDEAETLYRKLAEGEQSVATFDRLALCADLRGDFVEADQILERAHQLDPEFTLPPRLSPDEFEEFVDQALANLPESFRAPLETTELVIEPVPSIWMVDLGDPGETPPDLLGLFVGASELEKSEIAGDLVPRRIFLFQRNLERASRTQEELVQELRTTLFHEIGHMLGFDEAGVAAMGLE